MLGKKHTKKYKVNMDKKGRCFFLFTFSKEVTATEQNIRSQNYVLGIDLGVNNLAVTSDSKFYNSAKVKQVKRKFKYLRSKLQRKGTRSSKRLLVKLSGRETRWMKHINHCISKDIVSHFDGNKIVMENLKGIRRQRRGRIMNYWISNWSFYQLQSFIQYKAEMKGIEVVRVNPNYTSQICHKCGQIGSRSKGCFSCHCGFLIPLRFSIIILFPSKLETMSLLIQWFICFIQRVSLPESFTSNLLLERVPFL